MTLETIAAKAAAAVVATLINFIGAHTPERASPLTWDEAMANVPGMAAAGDPDAAELVAANQLAAVYGPGADCDRWCINIPLAQQAFWRGDNRGVVQLAADAYGIPEQAARMAAAIRCESGWATHTPGPFAGWAQQVPAYWAARSTAAGFAGWSIEDPVAQAFVMAHMLAAGGPQAWGNWPVCRYAV